MTRAALVVIPPVLAILALAGRPAAQRPRVGSTELEDGWTKLQSKTFQIEIPRGYSFVDVTAPDAEYQRDRLRRQSPSATTLLEDAERTEGMVLVAIDRGTVRSHFVDHFILSKSTPADWTREQAESTEDIKAFAARLAANASAAGERFECELFEWRGRSAIRKKTTRLERTARGRYLKLVSLEHWFFAYPDRWHLAYETVEDREESVKRLAERTALSLLPTQEVTGPATKLVPRTAGDVSLLLPEGFEMVSLAPDPNPLLDHALEKYPAAQGLVKRFRDSQHLAIAFDPETLGHGVATTITFARYPLPADNTGELLSKEYVESYVARLREKWERSGLRTDGIQLFPLGEEGPVYRYDCSSPPVVEGGERILRRQLAYFAPPQVWLMTFTLGESQAETVERCLLDVAASFAPLVPSVAATPGAKDH